MKWRNSLVWIVIIGCLTASAAHVQAGIMLEQGKAVLEVLESQQIEAPAKFKSMIARLELASPANLNLDKRSDMRILTENTREVVVQGWSGNAWINMDKYINTMNPSMTEILSEVHQIWDGSAWGNSDRFTMNTNTQGQILSLQFDEWVSGAWAPDMLMAYSYDGNGNMTEVLTQYDDNYDGTLDDMSKIVSTYQNNQLVKDEHFFNFDGSWQKITEVHYTYNGQGQLVEEVTGMDLGFGFSPSEKTIYTYTASGKVETMTTSTYSMVTQDYTNSNKTTYTYNAQGDVTSELNQVWDGSQWENVNRYTNQYGGTNGQISEVLYETWDGAWTGDTKNIHTYDAQGNEIEHVEMSWDGASWVNVDKETMSYQNNLPVESITQLWDGSTWVNDSKSIFTYSGGTGLADLDELRPGSFSLSNYPNPFNPSTTIHYVLPASDEITVTVFDALGAKVKTLVQNEKMQSGMHEVHWDGSNAMSQPVPSGIYFYQVRGEHVNQTNRCLLLK